MPPTHGALVVFGSGPGIGRNVGALFAERGFDKVIVLSRNSDRLREDANFVRSARAGTLVEMIQIDLADTENVRQALKTVEEKLKDTPLEAVLYNAARVGTSKLFDFSSEQLETDLKISIVSLYTVAQWALPRMVEIAEGGDQSPSFLVTSGMLYKDPFPVMFALGASKGGQYNLVHSLHKEFSPKGVHCALIVVGGRVADDSQVTSARNVAEEAWKLFKQGKGKGDLDVVMMDPAYAEHMKRREQEK